MRGRRYRPFGTMNPMTPNGRCATARTWLREGTHDIRRRGIVKAPIANLADFAALDPFFRIIEQGLAGLAGPGHFFDLLAEDITVEYVVTVPGTRGTSRAVPRSPSCTALTAP